MRAEFRHHLPDVPLVAAFAEQLPLRDASTDAVVCAQAFHWFDAERSGAEFSRVLRPGGGVGLIWNLRDESVPWVAKLTTLLERHRGTAPRARDRAWRIPVEASGRFQRFREQTFAHGHSVTVEQVVDRVLSVSFIAALPPPARDAVGQQVRDLLEEDPSTLGRSTVEIPYTTEAYWTFKS